MRRFCCMKRVAVSAARVRKKYSLGAPPAALLVSLPELDDELLLLEAPEEDEELDELLLELPELLLLDELEELLLLLLLELDGNEAELLSITTLAISML